MPSAAGFFGSYTALRPGNSSNFGPPVPSRPPPHHRPLLRLRKVATTESEHSSPDTGLHISRRQPHRIRSRRPALPSLDERRNSSHPALLPGFGSSHSNQSSVLQRHPPW